MITKRDGDDLSRVYRPCRISEVYGQDEVKTIIGNMLDKGKVPHGLLFSGPSGTGKTTFARIVALGLSCRNAPTSEPCCECQSCRRIISNFSDMGYIEFNVADIKGIEHLRDIAKKYFGSFNFIGSDRKIFIFDECQKLSRDMQTLFLKVIEDASDIEYFVFCSSDSNGIIEPLKNRLFDSEFQLLSPEVIGQLVHDVCEVEDVKILPAAMERIIKGSGGMARNALKALQKQFALAGLL
jgi:DNA polymerase III subunit gamma/tau